MNCDYLLTECIPVISVADLKELINDPENISQRTEKIYNLRQKLDTIIEDGCWDLDDILLEHNYSDSGVFDCVVYFLAGLVINIKLIILHIYNINFDT